MIVFAVNSGSTSVKLAAFEAGTGAALHLISAERRSGVLPDPLKVLRDFLGRFDASDVAAVGHRVVHGGTRFTAPTPIDEEVETQVDALSALAPLHNPIALEWIRAAREVLAPEVQHVAVFDTAFFAQLPRVAAEYALPPELGPAQGVRRYGFHGLAHEAMWRRWCALRPDLERGGRLISLQLGGGCSIAAIERGRPLDTSMGFSPLEGLVMATRSGDVDPAIVPYLTQRLECTSERVLELLNRESGLLGVSGRTSDMTTLIADQDPRSQFAVELYCYRARKYVGAYLAALGSCDGIVFGGGIGENVPEVRERIFAPLRTLGIVLDRDVNAVVRGREACITAASSPINAWVIPIDEERALAGAACAVLRHPSESSMGAGSPFRAPSP